MHSLRTYVIYILNCRLENRGDALMQHVTRDLSWNIERPWEIGIIKCWCLRINVEAIGAPFLHGSPVAPRFSLATPCQGVEWYRKIVDIVEKTRSSVFYGSRNSLLPPASCPALVFILSVSRLLFYLARRGGLGEDGSLAIISIPGRWSLLARLLYSCLPRVSVRFTSFILISRSKDNSSDPVSQMIVTKHRIKLHHTRLTRPSKSTLLTS